MPFLSLFVKNYTGCRPITNNLYPKHLKSLFITVFVVDKYELLFILPNQWTLSPPHMGWLLLLMQYFANAVIFLPLCYMFIWLCQKQYSKTFSVFTTKTLGHMFSSIWFKLLYTGALLSCYILLQMVFFLSQIINATSRIIATSLMNDCIFQISFTFMWNNS